MKLTTTKLYWVITVTVISLIGIVLIQYNWIDNALKTEEDKFNERVAILFTDISQEIGQNCDLINEIRFATGCDCRLQSEKPDENQIQNLTSAIESIADSVFSANHFILDYEFGVALISSQNSDDSQLILTSDVNVDKQNLIKSRHKGFLPGLGNTASLNFFFPDESSYIARQIRVLLLLSVLFILMTSVCFGYVIMTIKKQKKLSEMKNDFINNLTHEFKTPIFSISLASKLLGKSKKIHDSKKLNRYLDLIHSENNRLRTQVDKVLQIAMIDSGNFHLNKTKVDLHKLIDQVCNTFSVILEEKGGSIHLQLNASTNILYGDEAHLSNLIYNLIDNGIKYTTGPPEITITTMDTDNGFCFTVKDNGIGVDAHIRKHIFDKFYRAQNGNVHDVKGFGLGLSYVKSIVEAHKGFIKLKSEKNSGSEFIVTFPVN